MEQIKIINGVKMFQYGWYLNIYPTEKENFYISRTYFRFNEKEYKSMMDKVEHYLKAGSKVVIEPDQLEIL